MVVGDVGLVLVHGAWGSPEMWRDVTDAVGVVPYEIRIADLPTTNGADATFADDVVHVKSLASAAKVVLCGHSYGCTVITAAAADLANVAHLVYLAGLALDDGETSAEWFAKRPSAVRLSLTGPRRRGRGAGRLPPPGRESSETARDDWGARTAAQWRPARQARSASAARHGPGPALAQDVATV